MLDEAWCSRLAVKLRLGEALSRADGPIAPFRHGFLGFGEARKTENARSVAPAAPVACSHRSRSDADRPLGRPIRSNAAERNGSRAASARAVRGPGAKAFQPFQRSTPNKVSPRAAASGCRAPAPVPTSSTSAPGARAIRSSRASASARQRSVDDHRRTRCSYVGPGVLIAGRMRPRERRARGCSRSRSRRANAGASARADRRAA